VRKPVKKLYLYNLAHLLTVGEEMCILLLHVKRSEHDMQDRQLSLVHSPGLALLKSGTMRVCPPRYAPLAVNIIPLSFCSTIIIT